MWAVSGCALLVQDKIFYIGSLALSPASVKTVTILSYYSTALLFICFTTLSNIGIKIFKQSFTHLKALAERKQKLIEAKKATEQTFCSVWQVIQKLMDAGELDDLELGRFNLEDPSYYKNISQMLQKAKKEDLENITTELCRLIGPKNTSWGLLLDESKVQLEKLLLTVIFFPCFQHFQAKFSDLNSIWDQKGLATLFIAQEVFRKVTPDAVCWPDEDFEILTHLKERLESVSSSLACLQDLKIMVIGAITCFILNDNDDVWAEILSHLDDHSIIKAGMVDRKRLEISKDRGLKPSSINLLLLSRFNPKSSNFLTDRDIARIKASIQKYKTLDLSKLSFSRDQLAQLFEELKDELPQLETLNLNKLGLPDHQLNDQRLLDIIQKTPELIDLNIVGCNLLTNTSAKHISANCSKLRKLNLASYVRIQDCGIQAIAGSCPELQELTLTKCFQITDVSIQAIASNCPGLQKLDLLFGPNVTDASILAITNNCK